MINIVRLVHLSVYVIVAYLKIENLMNFKNVQGVIKDFMNIMINVSHYVVMALRPMMNNVMMEILIHQMDAVINVK